MRIICYLCSLFLLIAACKKEKTTVPERTFQDDLNFLRSYHKDLVILGDSTAAQIIIAPGYQARVMTSTTSGKTGKSFGWINYDLIRSGKIEKHINAFGGEERFWLGPEGGQFGLYFPQDSAFNFNNWQVPPALDTEPFVVKNVYRDSAVFTRDLSIKNYSGTTFDLKISRTIKMFDESNLTKILQVEAIPKDIAFAGFETRNKIINTGKESWKKETGLISVWILSMLNATPNGVVAVPYREGTTDELGPVVTDDYFGKVPSGRLVQKSGLLVFKADARHRSKIGVSGKRALPWIASYEPKEGILTLAQFSLGSASDSYVNSQWGIQENPFSGDAVNAYNDGPNDTGNQLGEFYELESSSPGAMLAPGDSLIHIHRTFHFTGSSTGLEQLFKSITRHELSEVKF
jgi:hypothetical protein